MVYDLTPSSQSAGKILVIQASAVCIPAKSYFGTKEKISPAGDSYKIL